MSRSRTEAAAWTVASDPEVVAGGARAVALLLAVTWQSQIPLLPWRLPYLPEVLDRLYEFIARNRARLPGAVPWCVAHPGACEPPPADI